MASLVQDLDFENTNGQILPGLANIFEAGITPPVFSNYIDSDLSKLNVGLLDNSVIPMIESTMRHTIAEVQKAPGLESDYYLKPNEHGTTVIINKYTIENNNDETTVIIGGDSTE